MTEPESISLGRRHLAAACGSAALLWLAQPPVAVWPLALIAMIPWLNLIELGIGPDGQSTRPGAIASPGPRYRLLWLVGFFYWAVTLQGLRHAHPAMYLCWLALAGYLAGYLPLFFFLCRRCLQVGLPLWLAAPTVWVGCECLRNYLLTGISAVMLGHSMANVPRMIQIADLFGTYGVSFVIVSANVAGWRLMQRLKGTISVRRAAPSWIAAVCLVAGTLGYAVVRDRERSGLTGGDAGVLTCFALIQRDEEVEYAQDLQRAVEIFQSYANQSVESLRDADRRVDAVVWPESMFSGGSPWMTVAPDPDVAEELGMSTAELRENVRQRQALFLDRAAYVQATLASVQGSTKPPDLIAGCGVVHYGDVANVFSGVVHLSADGQVSDWYGKTHLVMFGEYVPLLPSIPLLRSLVPPGLGLQTGPGAKRFRVGETAVMPNICIETAVERVTINQVAQLLDRGEPADVVVTVTNDGWFDDSSVIEHHLRCAQLVAVGCRRPVLSAANNGPTAWIDSRGQLVERLPRGSEGAIIATPVRDSRNTLYLKIGDWPARGLALLCLAVCGESIYRRWKSIRAIRPGEGG